MRLLVVSPLDLSGVEIINAGNDANLLCEFTKAGFVANLGRHETGVLHNCEVCDITILISDSMDGRLNVAHQRLHMTWGRLASQSGRNRTASLVAKNDHQTHAEMFDRILDAAQSVVIDEVAGVPNHEKVPDVLVEDDFWRCAGICAAENDGKRMLCLGGLCTLGRRGLAFGDFAAGKTGITLFEFSERGICADGRSFLLCARDKRREAKQTDGRNEGEFGCDVHFRWLVMANEGRERKQHLTIR